MSQPRNLARRVSADKKISFVFKGKNYTAHAGDTLASALLAAGEDVVARSFKVHRPRGVFAIGSDEPNVLVDVGTGDARETNVRATQLPVFDGMVAASVNCWPSPKRDVGGLLDRCLARFMPSGFYYKTFMWPSWNLWDWFIRRSAGLGKPLPPQATDPQAYTQRHAHCDVLVVGAGPAGLAAAGQLAAAGLRVILADEDSLPGGNLRGEDARIDGQEGFLWAERQWADLRTQPNVTCLASTTVSGVYDDGFVTAIERRDWQAAAEGRPAQGPAQTLWKIRPARILLATGAIERPMVFPDNDRPGVMLASALRRYVRDYGVVPARRIVLTACQDSVYGALAAYRDAGITVAAVIDPRHTISSDARQLADAADVPVFAGQCIAGVKGRHRVSGVQVCALDGDGRAPTVIPCDAIAVAGGWNPVVHLWSHTRRKLDYSDDLACFVPRQPAEGSSRMVVAGAARGRFNLPDVLADAHAVAAELIGDLGGSAQKVTAPVTSETDPAFAITPFWQVPEALAAHPRQWIDHHNDVTVKDVGIARKEAFTAVEHLKRYTTLGMGPDQGKTSNVNGLAVMGALTGRTPRQVGTTTFRPPYAPVTFGAIAGNRVAGMFAAQRKLPTHAVQLALDPVMHDYGGWQRPAWYPAAGESRTDPAASVAREVKAVRTGVGLIDYSPLGKIRVEGPDAVSFLELMLPFSVGKLKVGRARYTLLLSETGIVVDDGIVSRLSETSFIVGTTSGGVARMTRAFEEWRQCEWPDMNVSIIDETTGWAVLMVTGPKARDLMQTLSVQGIDFTAEAFAHMTVQSGTLEGVPARVNRVSFSGELSYEVSVPAGYAASLWSLMMERGKSFGITPLGLEALLVLRLEKGFLHVGSDTDGNSMPHDLGFPKVFKNKEAYFVGRRSLSMPVADRTDRQHLVGLKSLDGRCPPAGAHLVAAETTSVPAQTQGYVSSSAHSPTLDQPVMLALLQGGHGRMGERLRAYSLGEWFEVEVIKPGAYDPEGERIHV